MKKLLFGLIVIFLALSVMAPGTPRPKPTTVVTEPPATEPVETEPPAIDTEPVVVTEPPVVVTDVWEPQWLPTREGKERKDAALPGSGFGPPVQSAPACASMLLAAFSVAWKVLR
jgi:hypothetical protein